MDFKSFYLGLDRPRRDAFAERAKTTSRYIEMHLVSRRKVPRPALMDGLAEALAEFGAGISKPQLVAFFYEAPQGSLKSEPVAA